MAISESVVPNLLCLGGEALLWNRGCDRLRDAVIQKMSTMDASLEKPPSGDHVPVIVMSEDVDDALCDRIAAYCREGCCHLLVVTPTHASVADGRIWRLMQVGACDVLACDRLDDPAAVVVSRIQRWTDIERIVDSPAVRERLVGGSRVWKAALRQTVELALYTRSPILVRGESGTGKELVAHLVHELAHPERSGEFVLLDCTTIVDDLSGSEFFGHERGAFTGAYTSRDGAFAKADGGTLFLDEVGELPLRLQAELLRVIQEGTYRRLGSNEWKRAQFRLVCATHRDLEADRERGALRVDFYYRLAGGICRLPALEERREDIPLLVEHFLRDIFGPEHPAVAPEVLDYLISRAYPGNVRELRQLVARMASRHVSPGPFTVGTIPDAERMAAQALDRSPGRDLEQSIRVALARGMGVEDIRQAASSIAYRVVLDEEDGDTALAARRLKVSTRAVQMYLRSRMTHGAAAGQPETGELRIMESADVPRAEDSMSGV